jgi:ankyrin repeat protein
MSTTAFNKVLSKETINISVKQTYNLDQRDQSGWNALHHACHQGTIECVKVLVEEAEIPINALTNSNNSPLHTAAKNGHLSICKYMIEHAKPEKANVLLTGLEGETPMETALDHGKNEVGEYLTHHENRMRHWNNRNCLLKLYLNKNKTTMFKKFSEGIFKEIIKYA